MADRILIVVAAEREARAVLEALGAGDGVGVGSAGEREVGLPGEWEQASLGRIDVVRSGVGKSNAAGATAKFLDPSRHRLVMNVGIGGALPGSGLSVLDAVVADECVFGDEGVRTPERFLTLSEVGFPCMAGRRDSVASEAGAARELGLGLGDAMRVGAIATVSVCSGTDELAAEIRARTGAIAEGMEGAACGLVAARAGVRFAELRVISNRTGRRDQQGWNLAGAFERLGEVLGPMRAAR
ncbi:MAG: futalosine hydrolase [Phycisphaerales bacterium]|jgi:futalosine hydrolase|nr:futalosine hydrolase [Phycisphaerales bacterium]